MINYDEMSEETLEQMWDEEQKIEDKAEADSIEKSEDPEVEWEAREEERQIQADEDKAEEDEIQRQIDLEEEND